MMILPVHFHLSPHDAQLRISATSISNRGYNTTTRLSYGVLRHAQALFEGHYVLLAGNMSLYG